MSPATAVVLLLSLLSLVLLSGGWIIQRRNRSPYSGSQMDESQRRRFNVGAWLAALGSLCALLSQFVTWR
jgi:hypothetical protein